MTGARVFQDAALVAAVKTAVSALVLALGFRALSDDDFARVVIAQSFAAAPSLDPSGTSWLPFPFWLQGGVMLVAGRSLDVARVSAFVLGVLSAVLVHTAARWVGASRGGALLGALMAAGIPYAAWLGVATVPDGFTAALITLGAASATGDRNAHRLAGGAALLLACLSRYEAWPVAAAFALLTGVDAWRDRSRKLGLAAALPVLGPFGWGLHGAIHHGDWLFFVSRVTAYHRAVDDSASSLLARVLDYPLALLRCEPELAAVTLLALAAAWRWRRQQTLRRYARPALLLGAMLATLIVANVRDSAPTHHAERTLLGVWLGCAILSGDLLCPLWHEIGRRWRVGLLSVGATLVLLAALVARPWYSRRDDFVDRSLEVDIGRAAARFSTVDSGCLMVDTRDYGFYAVIAGFARPDRAAALDERDPRRPRESDAFASAAALHQRLRDEGAAWLVARAGHAGLALDVGTLRARNAGFVLVQVER